MYHGDRKIYEKKIVLFNNDKGEPKLKHQEQLPGAPSAKGSDCHVSETVKTFEIR